MKKRESKIGEGRDKNRQIALASKAQGKKMGRGTEAEIKCGGTAL